MAAKVKLETLLQSFISLAGLVDRLIDTHSADAATINGLRADLADGAEKLKAAVAEDDGAASLADELQTKINALADKAAAAAPPVEAPVESPTPDGVIQ